MTKDSGIAGRRGVGGAVGALSMLVAGLVMAAPAAAAPSSVLGADELPGGYAGYQSREQSGEIAMVPSGDLSTACLNATAAAATATRGARSQEAFASRGRYTLTVAVLSKPAAVQLGNLLERCAPGDSEQAFAAVGVPADLVRFAPRLYWNASGEQRVAYVNVRQATVVVRTVGPAEPFWETLRKQVAKADR
ncbi:hypothetical protein [Tsukamurella strandjordii]|uniref:Sensor domain-containing protein n=1 Tax=Tsukamurella strandjordii TaxID=147577 RepID=A0AA90N821_9ACTN|nr:hypothetical protein [Tsukamurella strandjordii]MDP0396738.1 hypothetical protein [Tsukamurella strandjordii]